MPAFDSHERGDMPPRGGGANLIRRGGELHQGIRVRERAHRPNQVQCSTKRSAVCRGVARVHPDREERGREPSLLHARHVDMTVGEAAGHVGSHVEHALRRIDVAVHDDGLLEQEQES